MLSRNKVTSITQISSRKSLELMKNLNKQKIKWIVREVTKREKSVWAIAQTQDITKQHAYRVAKRFKNHEPEFKKCGRKPIQ